MTKPGEGSAIEGGENRNAADSVALEQLARAVPIAPRKMFGCTGVYTDDAFFAIVDGHDVYFKVDERNLPGYVARGMGPFQPSPHRRRIASFYRVPDEVLADPQELQLWVMGALAAARRARKG